MWPSPLVAVLSAAILASDALAQRYTTTLPYVDGNTIVVTVGTNVLGVPFTSTLSTITATATQLTTIPAVTTALTTPLTTALTTALTTPLTTPTTTRTTPTTRRTTQTTGPDTTAQRVVGQDTTAPPMRTTTYWYDPGNGVWTVATWTASVTAAPQVATANVPSGTIQDYNAYQTIVNSAVLSAAQSADGNRAAKSAGYAQAGMNAMTGLAMILGGAAAGVMGVLAF